MKTILVATDFSDASKNAVQYAADMAVFFNADLLLFHAYHTPPVVAEFPVSYPTLDDVKKEAEKSLDNLRSIVYLTTGKNFDVKCVCECGFAVDLINDYVKEQKVDMVVMGMQGADKITETLIGSITTSVIREGKSPVMAVDSKMKFKPLKKIVLACDYKQFDGKILSPLKDVAERCQSHIAILNVTPNLDKLPGAKEATCAMNVDTVLTDFSHSFHFYENGDTVNGINDFVIANKADLVVMIPRSHSFIKNIFSEPETKRMAFHSVVPLLAIHE